MDVTRIKPSRKTRASKPKVKSGCITCKECGGYASPFHPKHQLALTKTEKSSKLNFDPQCETKLNITVLLGLPEEYQDRRYFVQFLHGSALQLSGFFTAAFWNRYVSQASSSSQVVQLAVLALGAQHQAYKLSIDSDLSDNRSADQGAIEVYSLKNYQNAIKVLNSRLKNALIFPKGVEELLLACLLFICIELLRGDVLLALTHLEGGLRILNTSLPTLLGVDSKGHEVDPFVSDLIKMFALMDMQTPSYVSSQVCLPSMGRTLSFHPAATLPSVTDKSFSDLSDALDSFNSISAHIQRFVKTKAIPLGQQSLHHESANGNIDYVRNDRIDARKEREVNIRLLVFWKEKFEDLLRRRGARCEPSLTANFKIQEFEEAIEQAILWLAYSSTLIALCTCLEASEISFDGHLASFEAMLRYAHLVLLASHQAPQSSLGSRQLSLQAKIIQPLYFVALKCRDYHIRMHAIQMLRSTSGQRACGGEIEAAIAGYVMYVEELKR
ncbi:MAG: hypothetical protein Q9170_002233 [Blastenia crenularia]